MFNVFVMCQFTRIYELLVLRQDFLRTSQMIVVVLNRFYLLLVGSCILSICIYKWSISPCCALSRNSIFIFFRLIIIFGTFTIYPPFVACYSLIVDDSCNARQFNTVFLN